VETDGERQRTVSGACPQCRQVSFGEEIPGQPDARGEQQPDAPLSQDLPHEGERSANGEQRGERAKDQRPEQRVGPQAGF
nr:hypothetical protein [Tanacetum cinerariifolium]